MNKIFDTQKLDEALLLLHEQLELHNAPHSEIVVCGGSALIAIGLVSRTTRDVDVVALMHRGELKHSEPLPEHIQRAATKVSEILGLPDDWLNCGPASQLSMGLPQGFQSRLHRKEIGEKLVVHYIDRTDQIYFKTFAAADRGGYHISDLKALNPSEDELLQAARWCMTQDISEGFRFILKEMLIISGWNHVAERI